MRHLLFRLLSGPIVHAIGWTEEERKVFDQFCRSMVGQKFLEFLRQHVARVTFNAVYQTEVSANAYARGQQDILALFLKLRVFPSEVAESGNGLDLERTFTGEASETESDEWRWIGGGGAIG
jgi:hypothetical protein